MRAIVSVVFILVVLSGAAQAQPGQPPPPPPGAAQAPQPYPPPPAGPPQGQPMQPQPYPPPYPPGAGVPPPYQYAPVQLTPEEQKLLQRGEINIVQHAGGVALNWLVGFGIGQALQGRWSDTGWIFTVGEAGSLTLMIVGAVRAFSCSDFENSCSNGDAGVLFFGGLIGYVVFHIWSIVDAAIAPANHNRKVRDIRRRVGIPVMEARRVVPYMAPVMAPAHGGGGGGGVAGLTFRF
jgi:hypothetical protein